MRLFSPDGLRLFSLYGFARKYFFPHNLRILSLCHCSVLNLRQLCHFGNKAYFGATFGKFEHVPILEIGLCDLSAVQVCAVGAMVNQLELVPFTNYVGMFSRDTGSV